MGASKGAACCGQTLCRIATSGEGLMSHPYRAPLGALRFVLSRTMLRARAARAVRSSCSFCTVDSARYLLRIHNGEGSSANRARSPPRSNAGDTPRPPRHRRRRYRSIDAPSEPHRAPPGLSSLPFPRAARTLYRVLPYRTATHSLLTPPPCSPSSVSSSPTAVRSRAASCAPASAWRFLPLSVVSLTFSLCSFHYEVRLASG